MARGVNTEIQEPATMRPSLSAIGALPKADLHSHIDGSVSARQLFQIARRHRRRMFTPKGRELDSVTAFMRYIEGDGYDSMLENVVDRFYPITGLMQSEETIREVGTAYVEEQGRDGVVLAEGRFAPQYHTREGLSFDEVIGAMAEGLKEGSERYGVETALIVAIGRESSPSLGNEVVKAACRSGLAVALDLGGPEAGYPPEKFREAFEIAAAKGLKATIHAGEGAGSRKQNLANITTAISLLKADRVGHAIDLSRDDRLVSLVADKSITVEMNPVSNLVLQKINDLRDLGIDQLLRRGIRVTVNSDDPSLWPKGRLSDVYSALCQAYWFGMKELDILIENSFEGSFSTPGKKRDFIEQYRTARKRFAR